MRIGSVALLAAAAAAAGEGWEQQGECEGGDCVGVWTRDRPGTGVREVKAVGEIDAPPDRVFAVVTDYEHQSGNLPYVEDQKVLERTGDHVIFWTVARFPLVARRDWVVRSRLEPGLPGGVYRASWEPVEWTGAPDPENGVVRLKVNSGSWTLEPLDGGARTRATYTLCADPGGSIPAFIANSANSSALPELFAAVRRRAAAKRG